MLIRPMSDLHLEFGNPFVPPVMEGDAETVLVLAGDISNKYGSLSWIREVAPRFRHVVLVLGNHDYWKAHLQALPGRIKEKLADVSNVSVLERDGVLIDGVRFLGTTLWTDFDRENPLSVISFCRYMRDCDFIRTGGYRRITGEDILQEHRRARHFLETNLAVPFEGPTVVVTHHGPSDLSVHGKYDRSYGNEYYKSDLTDLIFGYEPKYWIHGHTHERIDYTLGETRVVVNPYGYHGYETNGAFEPELRLEV